MDLTDADVTDILALLDSLPYDELDLQTPRFRLTLRRTPHGWTQSTQVLSAPATIPPAPPPPAAAAGSMEHRTGYVAAEKQPVDPRRPRPGQGTSSMRFIPRRLHGRLDVTSRRPDGDGCEADGAEGPDGERESAGRELSAGQELAGQELAGQELVAVRAPLPGTFYRAPRPGAAPFVEVGSRVSADTVIGIVETMKLMNSVHAGVAGTVAEFCVQNAEFAAHGATLLRIRADT